MSAKRYLGTFFRGRKLFIPVLLLLLAATALGTYYLGRTQYQATAHIWVDKPVLDSVLDPNAATTFVSPGQQEADKINQLLQTDSFVAGVLTNTTAAARLANETDRDRVIKEVRGKLTVTPSGNNSIAITYSGSDPVLCQQIVQGTIDQFRAWDLTTRVEQTAIETQFYQKQLQIYQDQADTAAKAVTDYQTAHPYPDPSSPQYLELQSLQRESESARALLNATQTKIEQANAASSLSDNSRQAEFQVLDAPTVPNRPAATLTKLVEYGALGVIVSLIFVLAAVAFATWQDTTIRSGEDLQRLTSVPLLDVIPHLSAATASGGGRPQPAGTDRASRKSPDQLTEPAKAYSSRTTK